MDFSGPVSFRFVSPRLVSEKNKNPEKPTNRIISFGPDSRFVWWWV